MSDGIKAFIFSMLALTLLGALLFFAIKQENSQKERCEKSGNTWVGGRVDTCFEKGTVVFK